MVCKSQARGFQTQALGSITHTRESVPPGTWVYRSRRASMQTLSLGSATMCADLARLGQGNFNARYLQPHVEHGFSTSIMDWLVSLNTRCLQIEVFDPTKTGSRVYLFFFTYSFCISNLGHELGYLPIGSR